MVYSLFIQISLVIAVAALFSIIMRALKQPLILGYILTGVVTGPIAFNVIHDHSAFETFSKIGISLLLFIIGLGLNVTLIKSLGKTSLLTAMCVASFLGIAGFGITKLFGFSLMTSAVMGVALLFSSTIIIMKVASDKHEVGRLYARLAIGVLLIEDILATLAMIGIAMISQGEKADSMAFVWLALKAVGLAGLLYLFGAHIIPRFQKFLASSRELLFLFSLGWGLSIAALFEITGFSSELGALFAGISLASLPYSTEMAVKLKPLRDFFLVLFFVTLGELFVPSAVMANILPALALATLVMLGKPIVVLLSLLTQKYTKFTSFKTSVHLSQVSEFSIVLVIYTASLGLIDKQAVALITLVALITIALSTYLMRYDDKLYKYLEHKLHKLERHDAHERTTGSGVYPALLLGYHKGGHEYVEIFRKMKQKYLVIDYNPDIIEHLEQQGIRHSYGDVTDIEFLEEINATQSKLVVSTIDSAEVNLLVLRYLRRHNAKFSFICHALNYDDAVSLYEHGASYVSLPHYMGSEKISNYIKKNGISHKALSEFRNKHITMLGKRATKS